MKTHFTFKTSAFPPMPGEEEELVLNEDVILLDDEGQPFGEECLSRSEYNGNEDAFTIENFYETEAAISELDNFEFTCTEL